MRCHRCEGLFVRDVLRSPDNDYGCVEYLRCINCGHYRFLLEDAAEDNDLQPAQPMYEAA